jgi:hypothetical protein
MRAPLLPKPKKKKAVFFQIRKIFCITAKTQNKSKFEQSQGVCDHTWLQVFGGMLVGALVCGGMTDTYGRKPVRAPHAAMMAGVAYCVAC